MAPTTGVSRYVYGFALTEAALPFEPQDVGEDVVDFLAQFPAGRTRTWPGSRGSTSCRPGTTTGPGSTTGSTSSWTAWNGARRAAERPPAPSGQAWYEASSTTVMSEGAPTRTGGPQAPAPRDTYNWVSP